MPCIELYNSVQQTKVEWRNKLKWTFLNIMQVIQYHLGYDGNLTTDCCCSQKTITVEEM